MLLQNLRATQSVALSLGPTHLTAAQLLKGAHRWRDQLRAHGVQPGDPVALWCQTHLQTVVALVGHLLGGFVTVPLNPLLGPTELAHILHHAAPKNVYAAQPDNLSAPQKRACRAYLQGSRQHKSPLPSGSALIVYTSGTTGPPKGVVLSHDGIAHNLHALAKAWQWSEESTIVHALPIFHVHGLVLGVLGSLLHGSHLQWLEKFSPSAIGHALQAAGSILFAVPTMYHRLLSAAQADPLLRAQLGAAELLISGSAGLPKSSHWRLQELLGRGVIERYGLTETLINTSVTQAMGSMPGYVGPALNGVEIRLVDDARRLISAWDDATLGEIAVRGPQLFAGYLHNSAATHRVVDEAGWFYTGDMGCMTSQGWLRLMGRRDTDLIKTGGYKVGAGEVENCLLGDPNVLEAAVVGLPHEDLGQIIAAAIVAKNPNQPPTLAALAERVSAELAPHKRPRHLVVLAALPKNSMGKILKHTLKKMLEASEPEQ